MTDFLLHGVATAAAAAAAAAGCCAPNCCCFLFWWWWWWWCCCCCCYRVAALRAGGGASAPDLHVVHPRPGLVCGARRLPCRQGGAPREGLVPAAWQGVPPALLVVVVVLLVVVVVVIVIFRQPGTAKTTGPFRSIRSSLIALIAAAFVAAATRTTRARGLLFFVGEALRFAICDLRLLRLPFGPG
jgi:preprotein translocase subunit SecG